MTGPNKYVTRIQVRDSHVRCSHYSLGGEVMSAPPRISSLVLAVATIREALIHEHQPPRCQLTLVITTDFILVHFKHREGSDLSEPITRGRGVPGGSNTWQALVYSGTSYSLHSSNHRRCCNEFRSKDWAHPPPRVWCGLGVTSIRRWKILSPLPRAGGRKSRKFDSFQLPLPSQTMSLYFQICPRGRYHIEKNMVVNQFHGIEIVQ